MQSQGVTFSASVSRDLKHLITHLHTKTEGYNPGTGFSPDHIAAFIRSHGGPEAKVVRLSPAVFGGPAQITPVHDVLNRLQLIQSNDADYATGIVELAVTHKVSQPVDIDFQDRHFCERNLNRLAEPFAGLVRDIQAAIDAHLIAVIPNPFRSDTLVLVILLGRNMSWGEQHEQTLHCTLESITGVHWTLERKPLE
jgi:hypothetical protein